MSEDLQFYSTLLNILVFLPLAGIPLILLLKSSMAKYLALGTSVVVLVLTGVLYTGYLQFSGPEIAADGFVFQSSAEWFSARYDIKFITGIDGITIYLVLLNAILFPLAILFSMGSVTKNEKGYYNLLLLLMTGVTGVFVSLDLVLFYVFFELGLIPMYFLIGIWGGKNRIYASVKFFLYTLVGSLLMMVAILYLGFAAGPAFDAVFTSDYLKIIAGIDVPGGVQNYLFWGFALSFLIKVPVFPVHTWLPDAHVQAPTSGSVILAGILLKMGTYGLIRFCLPLFPEASIEAAPCMALLGVIGITYGAMAAMVQTDIKKLVAYSSVAHMGFIVLGIFAMTEEAMAGSVIQMINHGISTGGLFLLVGMIYDRRHSREISDFKGIAKQLPVFTLLFMITTMSSIGLPGLNGFVGEFLILIGSFGSPAIGSPVYTIIATTGVIIAAVYMLWMFRRVMFGQLDKEENKNLKDLNTREVGIMLPLILLMFLLGFYATPFLEEISLSSDIIVSRTLEAMNEAVALR